jgi:hypothetical protein
MKFVLAAFLLNLIALASADAFTIECPEGQLIIQAITDIKPKNQEQLQAHRVGSLVYGKSDKWDLADVSIHGKRALYLSCLYDNGKVVAKKIAVKFKNCQVRSENGNLSIECLKR